MAEGKTRAEATRALKRHPPNAVYALCSPTPQHMVSGEDNRAA